MAERGVFDLLIVGGGPAGMAAARTASGFGLSIAIVDEQPRPGGQILRQPPASFAVAGWLPDRGYREVRTELAAFEALDDITWLGGRSVAGLAREAGGERFVLYLAGIAGADRVTATHVLVAAGCYDLPLPLPGWTLPGVMAAGGVQAFLKSQQLVPGDRFVLAGTHPLMLVIAAQLVAAGGQVAAVAFEQRRATMAGTMLRHAATALANASTLAAGAAAFRALRRHRVPVLFGERLAAVRGANAVTAAVLAGAAGERDVACDRVALCFGFLPQSDLPRLAGASVRWAEPVGGWRTDCDEWMRTDVPGLSVGGETAGVAGAAAGLSRGRLAALGILLATGRIGAAEAERRAAPVRRRLRGELAFADMLAEIADPGEAVARIPPPATILCRCEDVTYGTVATALEEVQAPNAIKLMTRVGMGLCQGRTCEAALLRAIAAHGGQASVGRSGFTIRFPVRPVRIGDIVDVADAATHSSPADP